MPGPRAPRTSSPDPVGGRRPVKAPRTAAPNLTLSFEPKRSKRHVPVPRRLRVVDLHRHARNQSRDLAPERFQVRFLTRSSSAVVEAAILMPVSRAIVMRNPNHSLDLVDLIENL